MISLRSILATQAAVAELSFGQLKLFQKACVARLIAKFVAQNVFEEVKMISSAISMAASGSATSGAAESSSYARPDPARDERLKQMSEAVRELLLKYAPLPEGLEGEVATAGAEGATGDDVD